MFRRRRELYLIAVSTPPSAARQHAAPCGLRLLARSGCALACRHARFAGLSAFLPLRPRPAALDEPMPAASGSTLVTAPRDDFLKARPKAEALPRSEGAARACRQATAGSVPTRRQRRRARTPKGLRRTGQRIGVGSR